MKDELRNALFVAAMLVALLLAINDARAEKFSSEDWARQAAFWTLLAIDYGQTRDIKNNPGMYETNPLLGKHPSDERIRNYFIGAAIGHAAIAYVLPREYRVAWQWVWIGVEAGYVAHNYNIGLRTDF